MSMSFDAAPSSFDSDALIEAKTATARNKFSPEVADRLLDKLGSDDGFRELFLADPRAALRMVGHETPAADLGVAGLDPIMCCLDMTSLASKEVLQASRQQLRERLSAAPFTYDITM